MSDPTILAWHFCRTDSSGVPVLRDGSPMVVGKWLPPIPDPTLCRRGYHGSRRVTDALRYAPGGVLCRVRHRGQIVEADDKLVSSERRVLWSLDATALLRAHARWSTIQVMHLWDAPVEVRRWLRWGREADRAAARSAARAAAWSAARAAAWSAARAAARSAAWDAAWAAARDAAWAAAWSAARAAARSAAWDAALLALIREARQGYTEWEWTDVEVDDE